MIPPHDYLRPMGSGFQRLAAVASAIAGLLLLGLGALVTADMLRRNSPYLNGKPLWVGAALLWLLGATALWVAWRLRRRAGSSGAPTLLPPWFLQGFGFVTVLASPAAAWGGKYLLAAEMLVIGVGVLLAGRRLRRLTKPAQAPDRPQPQEAPRDTGT